jgi:hypothetical protein
LREGNLIKGPVGNLFKKNEGEQSWKKRTAQKPAWVFAQRPTAQRLQGKNSLGIVLLLKAGFDLGNFTDRQKTKEVERKNQPGEETFKNLAAD